MLQATSRRSECPEYPAQSSLSRRFCGIHQVGSARHELFRAHRLVPCPGWVLARSRRYMQAATRIGSKAVLRGSGLFSYWWSPCWPKLPVHRSPAAALWRAALICSFQPRAIRCYGLRHLSPSSLASAGPTGGSSRRCCAARLNLGVEWLLLNESSQRNPITPDFIASSAHPISARAQFPSDNQRGCLSASEVNASA